MSASESQFIAAAGEHFVAYKVALLGFVPALTQDARTIDLLVSSPDAGAMVGVQVESTPSALRASRRQTGEAGELEFPLSHRSLEQAAPSTIFCFVDFRSRSNGETPDVYVIGARELRAQCAGAYVRKYSSFRYVRTAAELQPYRNNWQPFVEALGGPARAPAEPAPRNRIIEALTIPRFAPVA